MLLNGVEVTKNYARTAISERKKEIVNKIESGETEEKVQVGGAAYTEREWNKLMDEIDCFIEQIKEEQEAYLEQKQAEEEQKEFVEAAQQKKEDSMQQLYEKMTATGNRQVQTCGEADEQTPTRGETDVQPRTRGEADEQTPTCGEADVQPRTRGVALRQHMDGERTAPYSALADENGIVTYNGVVFVCDYEHNSICLGDMTDESKVLTIPLEKGGCLKVNVDNFGDLSDAISMFSPEDIRRILTAMATYEKMQETELEIDEMEEDIWAAQVQSL